MQKVVIIGGGFAGCAAAITARKAGAQVVLLEKTDLLLGLGNVGGIMRNNGRYTAAEENIAMGARELFDITDRCSLHTGVDFPGHRHASFFDSVEVEPQVRMLLDDMGVDVRLMARVVDVEVVEVEAAEAAEAAEETEAGEKAEKAEKAEEAQTGYCSKSVDAGKRVGKADESAKGDVKSGRETDKEELKQYRALERAGIDGEELESHSALDRSGGNTACRPLQRIKAIILANGDVIKGDAFVEATGSAGPMGNCAEYGRGCSMCILRCPAFGPRVSISQKAGLPDLVGKRRSGRFGAFSGSGKLEIASLSQELQEELHEKGVAVIPLPPEKIVREKLEQKVCQQYALDEYAKNIILIDTGHAKIMSPYFPLDQLRMIPGFEKARYIDPYAGGKGNSIRYMSVAERENTMLVKGFTNLFCGGEKSGLFVGHTEAISTGSLAGHNAARYLAMTAAGAPANTNVRREAGPDLLNGPAGRSPDAAQNAAPVPGTASAAAALDTASNAVPVPGTASAAAAPDTISNAAPVPGVAPAAAASNATQRTEASPDAAPDTAPLLELPREIAIGDLIAYGNEKIKTEEGLRNRYTFAGDEFFVRMQERGLYTTDADLIRQRIEAAGLTNIYDQQLL